MFLFIKKRTVYRTKKLCRAKSVGLPDDRQVNELLNSVLTVANVPKRYVLRSVLTFLLYTGGTPYVCFSSLEVCVSFTCELFSLNGNSRGRELNIQKYSDWDHVTVSDVVKLFGRRMIRNNANSLDATLKIIYAQMNWDLVFASHFREKAVLESYYEFRQFQSLDDWYTVTSGEFKKFLPTGEGNRRKMLSPKTVLNSHGNSLIKALQYHYPDHPWIVGRFSHSLPHTWKNQKNLLFFLNFCKNFLDVKTPSDWQRVSREQIVMLGGASIFKLYGNLSRALEVAYPEEKDQFKKKRDFGHISKKSKQRMLIVYLKRFLPEGTVIYEDFQHPSLIWKDGSKSIKMELDVWIPSYNLAIEYQGEQHFQDFHHAFGPSGTLALYSERDLTKRKAIQQSGIRFVEIPYW